MKNNNYELSVLVGDKPIKEYFHKGKCFIEAKNGTEYSLKFRNNTPSRVLAVFSVDGINIVDGDKSSIDGAGYVVNAYSSVVVKGYRINNNDVAAFKFDESKNSYASLVENDMDKSKAANNPSANNGVIGVRVFSEKRTKVDPSFWNIPIGYDHPQRRDEYDYYGPKPLWYYSTTTYSYGGSNYLDIVKTCSANNIGAQCSVSNDDALRSAATDEVPNFTVGTTWGKQVEDKVTTVEFEKSEIYTDLIIYYLPRQELINYGVDLDNKNKSVAKQFPQAFENQQYCKIPAGWRG